MEAKAQKTLKHARLTTKLGVFKKLKRHNPSESKCLMIKDPNEANLMETPVYVVEEVGAWALVAGPKQPTINK